MAIVDIKAENITLQESPSLNTTIDQATGRMIVKKDIQASTYQRTGAGVIVDSSGLIVTNYHTIARANLIKVVLSDRGEFPAKVMSIFPQSDLALLYINPQHALVSIEFADSNELALGDEVFNIGHSQLLEKTISEGKITGLAVERSKELGANSDYHLIRVNMNLYKGDSGGPLLDRRGRLVGIITANESEKDRSCFVIPSNKIKSLYREYAQSKMKND